MVRCVSSPPKVAQFGGSDTGVEAFWRVHANGYDIVTDSLAVQIYRTTTEAIGLPDWSQPLRS